jgi:predicted metalloprotease
MATATCYIYQARQFSPSATNSTFGDCAAIISAEGGTLNEFAVGAWNRSYVIVNAEGEVYYRNGRRWQYWDTLAPSVSIQPTADDLDGDGVLNDADQCADQLENYNNVFDGDGCPDDVNTLLNFAVNDLNTYWQAEFDEGNLTYTAPRTVSAYHGRGRSDYNAYYTAYRHAIYYDIRLMNDALADLGDVAPVYILAHEFGHLVQSNLGLLNNGRYSIQVELEADCLAGAYLNNLDERGLLDEGDVEEGMRQAYEVGDYAPSDAVGAHGTPKQRSDAYTLGFENGADICLTSFN